MGQRDVDITPHILVSAYDPDNNGGMPLSRPESSIPNSENSQVVKLQLDKSVAKVKSEDVDGRTPLWHAISSANEVEVSDYSIRTISSSTNRLDPVKRHSH